MTPSLTHLHCWLLALTLLPAVAVAGNDTAQQWLERMSSAAHSLNYEGTFVYRYDGHMQTMRIVHGNDEHGERERLISLSGPPREVVRDNDRVTCILPDDNEVVVDSTGPARLLPFQLPTRLEAVARYYDFIEAGMDRVAGYPVRKMVITPRDRYRYGHHLWLHADQGLLLRSELVNEEGKVVEQLMFTSLTFFEQPPQQLLVMDMKGQAATPAQRNGAGDTAIRPRWQVTQLPPGFVLDGLRRHTMEDGAGTVEHLIYTDGLSSVSVFVEKESGAHSAFLGTSRKGAVNAYGRTVNGHHITVVGEVPPLTVQQMAESMTLADDGPR